MACVMVCALSQSFGWLSGLGRRCWMSVGVRSFCLVQWWVVVLWGGDDVVGLWKVGRWKLDFPFAGWGWSGVVYVWGSMCRGVEGVSLLERYTGLVMVRKVGLCL